MPYRMNANPLGTPMDSDPWTARVLEPTFSTAELDTLLGAIYGSWSKLISAVFILIDERKPNPYALLATHLQKYRDGVVAEGMSIGDVVALEVALRSATPSDAGEALRTKLHRMLPFEFQTGLAVTIA
jgi:hypothetical protein